MKKFIAVLTATALLAMPMCVSASTSAKDVSGNSSSAVTTTTSSSAASTKTSSSAASKTAAKDVSGNSSSAVASSSGSESSASTVEAAAEAAGMSVGEYTNNAIVSIPGLSDAAVVAQGGKIKVNGVATNMTITLRKVNSSVLKSAKAAATGKILSVFQAKLPVKGQKVEADFYVKGVTAESNVTALQLLDGTWTAVTVNEVRTDHVVVELSQSGAVMFVLN